MDNSGTYRTPVSARCRHTQAPCHPGLVVIGRLRRAIDRACDAVGDHLGVSGTVAVTDCGRACTLAYRGSLRPNFLFGDVEPVTDIDHPVATMRADTRSGALYSGDCDSGAVHGRAPATILSLECSSVAPMTAGRPGKSQAITVGAS